MHLAIFSGSVFGTADEVADMAAERCRAAGLQVTRLKPVTVDALLAADADALLACCSTTGMGELPASIQDFYYELQSRFPLLTDKPFGVIALGDSGYGDTFCQGGEQLRELLLEVQARELLPMLRLDASETVTPEEDAKPWLDEFVAALKG
ncbi:flavodoxin domain-containing protein [Halopseudomonas sp. Lyrl_26]|jgi:MioC protein|uniref:flavodoxin domain-containing protein n=1 Tax=Halopseudomonas sp. Lyrl_26 TaxID=3110923 RepID=UPI003F8148E2